MSDIKKFVPPFPQPYLSVTRIAVQSIPNNAITAVLFTTILKQYGIDYNTGTGIATITEDGVYIVGFMGQYAVNGVGIRNHYIYLNGVQEYGLKVEMPTGFTNTPFTIVTPPTPLVIGDTVAARTFQNSGAALNLAVSARAPEFGIYKLGMFN